MPGRLQVVRQRYGMEAGPPGNARVELGQAAFSIRVARLHGGVGSGHGKRRRPTVFRPLKILAGRSMSAIPPKADIVGAELECPLCAKLGNTRVTALERHCWLAPLHNPLSGQTHRG